MPSVLLCFLAILTLCAITEQSGNSLKEIEGILKDLAVQTSPKNHPKNFQYLQQNPRFAFQRPDSYENDRSYEDAQDPDFSYQFNNIRIQKQLEDDLQQAVRFESDRICKATGRCGCFGGRCGKPHRALDRTVDDVEQLLNELNYDLNKPQGQNYRNDEDRPRSHEYNRENYDYQRQQYQDNQQEYGYKRQDYDVRKDQYDRREAYDQKRQKFNKYERYHDRQQRAYKKQQVYGNRNQEYDERRQQYGDRRQRKNDERLDDRTQEYEDRRQRQDDQTQEYDDRRQKQDERRQENDRRQRQNDRRQEYDRRQRQNDRRQRQNNQRQSQDHRAQEYYNRKQRQNDRTQRYDDRRQRQDDRTLEYYDKKQRQDDSTLEYDDRKQRQNDRRQRQDDRTQRQGDRRQRQSHERQDNDDRRQRQDDRTQEYDDRRPKQHYKRQEHFRTRQYGDKRQQYDNEQQMYINKRSEYGDKRQEQHNSIQENEDRQQYTVRGREHDTQRQQDDDEDDDDDMDQTLKILPRGGKNSDLDIIILEVPESNDLQNRADDVKIIDVRESAIKNQLQQPTSLAKNDKKEQRVNSITLEDFVKYYDKTKREISNSLLKYIKGLGDDSSLSQLLPYQKKQIEYLKNRQSKWPLTDNELKSKIVELLFGMSSHIKLLPHSQDGQTIYIPQRVHNAIPSHNANNAMRSHKRLLPLTFFQKQRQRNLIPRNIILKHSWRRNYQQNPNYGVPFELQVQGLGQIN